MPTPSHQLKILVQNQDLFHLTWLLFKVYFDSSKVFQPIEMSPSDRHCTVFNAFQFPVNLNLKRMMEEIKIIEIEIESRKEVEKVKKKTTNPYTSVGSS